MYILQYKWIHLNYSDEQAMTLGELEMERKLYGLRCLDKVHKNSAIVTINIDSDKWNNNFRQSIVAPVTKSFSVCVSVFLCLSKH